MSNSTHRTCRVRLDYRSLNRLSLLLGFCAGLLSIPFVLLLVQGRIDISAFSIIIGAPVTGMACGLLFSVLGYPLYSWFSAKTGGQIYTGSFQTDIDDEQE